MRPKLVRKFSQTGSYGLWVLFRIQRVSKHLIILKRKLKTFLVRPLDSESLVFQNWFENLARERVEYQKAPKDPYLETMRAAKLNHDPKQLEEMLEKIRIEFTQGVVIKRVAARKKYAMGNIADWWNLDLGNGDKLGGDELENLSLKLSEIVEGRLRIMGLNVAVKGWLLGEHTELTFTLGKMMKKRIYIYGPGQFTSGYPMVLDYIRRYL